MITNHRAECIETLPLLTWKSVTELGYGGKKIISHLENTVYTYFVYTSTRWKIL